MASRKKSVSAPPAQAPATPSPELLLLDLRAAARLLSSTVWSVRGLLWRNEIPYIKIGRRFLIELTDLRAFIQRKKEVA